MCKTRQCKWTCETITLKKINIFKNLHNHQCIVWLGRINIIWNNWRVVSILSRGFPYMNKIFQILLLHQFMLQNYDGKYERHWIFVKLNVNVFLEYKYHTVEYAHYQVPGTGDVTSLLEIRRFVLSVSFTINFYR